MTQLHELTGRELLSLGQAITERHHRQEQRPVVNACPHCGQSLEFKTFTLAELELERHPAAVGGVIKQYIPCQNPDCVEIRRENLSKYTWSDANWTEQQYQDKLQQSGLGTHGMHGFDFEHFETSWPKQAVHRQDLVEALSKVTAWARDPSGIAILSGPYGTGKTRLAVAALKFYLRHGGVSAFHFACIEAWTSLKAIWNSPRGEAVQYRNLQVTQSDMLRCCQASGLLALDDLDKVKPGHGWLEWLLATVNYRVEHRLPFIITLNTPPREALAFLSTGGTDTAQALWERVMYAVTLQINFAADQPSYRQHYREQEVLRRNRE